MGGDEEPEEENWKQYIKVMNYNINLIENAKPEDRLAFVREVARCIQILELSTKGWRGWLSNYEMIDKITLEELRNLHPKLRQAVVDFVKLDVELTKKKFMEEEEKNKKKDKGSPQKPYLS
jgi:hypothetical protein